MAKDFRGGMVRWVLGRGIEEKEGVEGIWGDRRRGRRKGIGGRTEEETFPDLEEVGLCEVAAGC